MQQSEDILQVDVVSDVMCPWCFIGKRRLESALAMVPDLAVDIRWRPFQLDNTLPREGKDRRQYLREKFGGEDRAREIYQQVKDAGFEEGIAFAFDLIEKSPNTLDAHRLIRWAGGQDLQDAMVERLFELYFLEGADLTDIDTLVEAAEAVGMDGALTRELLEDGSDREAVEEEIALAQRIGVTGVPCFIIDNKYAVMGAQDAGNLASAFRQAAAQKAEEAQYQTEPATSDAAD